MTMATVGTKKYRCTKGHEWTEEGLCIVIESRPTGRKQYCFLCVVEALASVAGEVEIVEMPSSTRN